MKKENLDNGIKPDVNESLALAGLFRKVSVKERLPKKDDVYFIIHNGENISTSVFYTMGSGWLTHGMTIEYWLEEIELPTKEQIESEMKKRFTNWGGYFNGGEAKWFNRGARWMMNVLAGKAVTAKDNVR